ncbi:MAG: serine/threonine protein kinase [Deltaproteobacteria bacterium]|nr:serine/threonine protein kinase [Deltaproteobacteria bacterium]
MGTPQEFGDYHLLEKIATGGMAEVWRARAYGMAGFEKILVIKKVLPALSEDEEFVALFKAEARIAVQLQHVNIVQVFDFGLVRENDDKLGMHNAWFMAMEYVHGLDLARLVSRARKVGKVPIPIALFVISEVLRALQFAHERVDEQGDPLHIVHCDISPQNMLLSYAGEVKLTDFGIARVAFQADSTQEVVRGKYAYMSPEQANGEELDGRSDIFSLGIVFYEILTGRRLFKASSRDETLSRVRRAEVPSARFYRPEISEDLEALLLKALTRDKDRRFQSAEQMLDALAMVMVREGHRASNNELAGYLREVIETAARNRPDTLSEDLPPAKIAVLAIEAVPPPRTLATPRVDFKALSSEWSLLFREAGGELWEDRPGSALVVWRGEDLRETVREAVQASLEARRLCQRAGYRLAAGLAPGVARIAPETGRPPDDWELAGPFYLARWMMNLSAHRDRILLTEVGAAQVREMKASPLGRISIQGNRYINLYEVSGQG